ncbi:P-loop NTPase [Candidatus Bathyarchaeota archaeon]|nr:P-loop NTPase [Candidatus Bathyarchaeota archaeon]
MKQLTILSGKGGTGKTTLTASLAVLAGNAVLADCDVDAPDLHMLLHPEVIKTQEFIGSKLAVIDKAKCDNCGVCREKCRFDAITEAIEVDAIACEGCGVCAAICPSDAITMIERVSGYAYISKTKYGLMAHALLSPGESNSGKLVTLVRQNARVLSEKENSDLIIIDGPPGIGCPVIASLSGVDVGLVITEPTMSGIHDLQRALQLIKHFNVKPLVCVNMYDINKDNTDKILGFCEENSIRVVGKIPFNPKVTEAMVNGKTIVEYASESDVAKEIENIWKRCKDSF